ncbi:MAG: hypothetical protein RIN55_10330 [Tissierellaceae bacterium]|nr:hypothetical protein [Tissierellaceae bacterium]
MNRKIAIIGSIILLLIIILVPLPYSLNRNILVNQIDNSTHHKQQVSVTIDGVYYKFFVFNDRFIGRFEVEGLDHVKSDVYMRLLQDKETNMNLLTTNEPINRIVQNNMFDEFAICIFVSDEEGKATWGNDQGITITTFDSMNDVMKFLNDID